MTGVPPLSGKQHVIVSGRQRAVVTQVGAALRHYETAGVPVCLGFGPDELPTGSRGQVLAPWPNCLGEGSYEFEGQRLQVPLDGPGGMHALHGLVRWLPFSKEAATEGSVRLACVLHPRPGYPFRIRLVLEYRLSEEGLTVESSVTNEGPSRAPFGLGFHSYLDCRPELVDACSLSLPARTHLLFDERRLPVGRAALAGSPLGEVLAEGAGTRPLIGSLRLNECLTDLERGPDGRWRAELRRPPGPFERTTVWGDEHFGWVMVYSGDNMAPELARAGLAVEPMTCPPNALATGEGLVVLEPGERFEASWGITPSVLDDSPREAREIREVREEGTIRWEH